MDTADPRTFIDALHRLESQRDVEPIAALFSDDAELGSASIDAALRGRDGARRFWEAYRHSFDEIGSTFSHVVRDGDAALLEWTSRGRLPDGSPFEYGGVSVLEYDGGAIRRFRSHFDPARLRVRTA